MKNIKKTVFFISERRREGCPSLIGPFSTFESAHKKFLTELCLPADYEYTRYGSDLKKGLYYDEELRFEIIERPVL